MPEDGILQVAAIVPAYNAAGTIEACLRALAASERRPDDIIVVDDGSSDDTGALAEACRARVLASDRPRGGPGRARNLAAVAVDTDIVVFVDSDVVVAPEAIGRLVAPIERSAMAQRARGPREQVPVVATFGSYGDRSPVSRVAGRYANLRHHEVHQRAGRANPRASTFWSGMGAVRRESLLAAGGFAPRYGRPSIEDVELGGRLVAAGGAILIVPEAQGTHLKNWSVGELWRTDILQRAIPWAAMAVAQGELPRTLNADRRGRVSALALGLGLCGLALAAALWATGAARGMSFAWAAGAAGALLAGLGGLAVWVGCEWSLLRLLARHGARTVLGGALLHACYTIYAPATVLGAMVWLRWRHRGGGKAAAREARA